MAEDSPIDKRWELISKIRKEVDDSLEHLTAIRVEKADLTTTPINLRAVVEMILEHLKLEVVHRNEFVLAKLEKKGGNDGRRSFDEMPQV